MHRSSNTVAALASALAKAQGELVNPEKSLTATIRGNRPGESDRSFRYASLSTGLDIVRKALGQHEIAIVQSTAIDTTAGMVNLTTTLAHASGEWIASDWPVCPITETASPRRMGAALTYARRYALFTLVGIAGEDDLDAPDLNITSPASVPPQTPGMSPTATPRAPFSQQGRRTPPMTSRPPILAIDESARLRAAMIAEIESLSSSTAAAAWAQTMLRTKNSLTVDDARAIETAFEAKLSGLPDGVDPVEPTLDVTSAERNDVGPGIDNAHPAPATPLNGRKHPRPVTKTVRHRNKEHLRFVAGLPCLICAKQPADAHHLSFAQPRALGRKVSDAYTVPLCRAHHRAAHRAGKELAWWQSAGIAPLAVAESLWQTSRSGAALVEPAAQLTVHSGNGLPLSGGVPS